MTMQMKNLLLLPLMAAASLFAKDDFVSLFDGKTLKNWDGDPKF